MPMTVVADANNGHVSKLLEPYIQSGALNFLFGSGASFPAIATAGNIEAEIDAHLQAGEDEAAEKKSFALSRQRLAGVPSASADARQTGRAFRRWCRGEPRCVGRSCDLSARSSTSFKAMITASESFCSVRGAGLFKLQSPWGHRVWGHHLGWGH